MQILIADHRKTRQDVIINTFLRCKDNNYI